MGSIRRIVERLARGRSFWRRLPASFDHARILVTPDAALSMLKWGDGWIDRELLAVVDECVRPGDCVWDIGGNVGLFSVAAAVRAGASGAVLSVEPDLELAALIRKSAAALTARHASIMVLAVAVSEQPGVASFAIAARGRASNALVEFGSRSQTGGVRETMSVPVMTLDGLLDFGRPPALVKLDVEGAEVAAMRGATRLLREVRPILFVEVGREHRANRATLLRDAGYDLFDPSVPKPQRRPLEECVWNTLATPCEKCEG